jgi:hypothetical protein
MLIKRMLNRRLDNLNNLVNFQVSPPALLYIAAVGLFLAWSLPSLAGLFGVDITKPDLKAQILGVILVYGFAILVLAVLPFRGTIDEKPWRAWIVIPTSGMAAICYEVFFKEPTFDTILYQVFGHVVAMVLWFMFILKYNRPEEDE